MQDVPSDAKLRELVLFIAAKCASSPHFGATVLNKELFMADFIAYATLGKPITGHSYQRLEHGPAPRRLLPILEGLFADKSAAIEQRTRGGFTQKRVIALREPDLTMFTGPEMAVVSDVIETCAGATATALSQWSHRLVGWKLADEGDDIPYHTVFLSNRKPTKEEYEYALEIGRDHAA